MLLQSAPAKYSPMHVDMYVCVHSVSFVIPLFLSISYNRNVTHQEQLWDKSCDLLKDYLSPEIWREYGPSQATSGGEGQQDQPPPVPSGGEGQQDQPPPVPSGGEGQQDQPPPVPSGGEDQQDQPPSNESDNQPS